MRKIQPRFICTSFFLALMYCLPSAAQVATGTPPFGSFAGGPDVINLANLNSHLAIPVIHKTGRGTNFTYDLSYDSSVWYPVGASGSQLWEPVSNFGWHGVTEVLTGYVSAEESQEPCPPPTAMSCRPPTNATHTTTPSEQPTPCPFFVPHQIHALTKLTPF